MGQQVKFYLLCQYYTVKILLIWQKNQLHIKYLKVLNKKVNIMT